MKNVSIGVVLGVALAATGLVLAGCATSPSPVAKVTTVEADGSSIIEETQHMPTKALHKSEEGASAESVKDAAEGVPQSDVGDLMAYRIGSGDVLYLHSLDDETLNGPVTVRYDGFISLPQVADLNVDNLTREEATALVREAYSAIFAGPQISLVVQEVTSKSYTVMGNVETPGEVPYTKAVTLLDAINAAGGLRVFTLGGDAFVSAQGQLVKAFLVRHVDGERKVFDCDLRDLEQPGPHAGDIPVVPGDLIYIPDSVNLVYLLGEVGTPRPILLTEGMSLSQLFAYGGGFLESTARLRRIVLMREVDAETTEIMLINWRQIVKGGGDIPLQPGDIVYVPQKPLVRLQAFVERFTGSISPVLDLYRNVYESYYVDERLRATIRSLDSYGEDGASPTALPLVVSPTP